jgi:hypothetical protein
MSGNQEQVLVSLGLIASTNWELTFVGTSGLKVCDIVPDKYDSFSVREKHLETLNLNLGTDTMARRQLRAKLLFVAVANNVKKIFPICVCTVGVGSTEESTIVVMFRAYFGRIIQKQMWDKEYHNRLLSPITTYRE